MQNSKTNSCREALTHPLSHSKALVVLLSVIGVFYLSTLRDGHVWGDDFAMYVGHARNIVESRPYADTGYIFNPGIPIYAPTHYPPVFPLLLAPLYKIFGLNLIPMKVEQVAFLLSALVAVFTLWKAELPSSYLLSLIAILGFSPVFWASKDGVLSDVLFLFWFYLAAVLVRWNPDRRSDCWIRAFLVGMVLYLAIGTRSVGIAMVLGFLWYEMAVKKRLTLYMAAAVGICVTAVLVQKHLIGALPGGYLEEIHLITPAMLFKNVLEYVRILAGFWVGSVKNWFAFLVLCIFMLCAISGAVIHLRRGLGVVECFLIPYMAAILLWPFSVGGVRYIFPLLPWVGLLAMIGLYELARRVRPAFSEIAPIALVMLIAIPYLQAYRAADFGPIRESYNSPEFVQLCQAVRQQTRSEDVLIYGRARALSLYTGRRTSAYNYNGTDTEMWNWFKSTAATHLVTTDAFSKDGGFLDRFVATHANRLDLIYQNAHFRFYRIRAIE